MSCGLSKPKPVKLEGLSLDKSIAKVSCPKCLFEFPVVFYTGHENILTKEMIQSYCPTCYAHRKLRVETQANNNKCGRETNVGELLAWLEIYERDIRSRSFPDANSVFHSTLKHVIAHAGKEEGIIEMS